ncbi:MAG: trypsin-like peptidase domain-containing protein [Nakamurella sp.]
MSQDNPQQPVVPPADLVRPADDGTVAAPAAQHDAPAAQQDAAAEHHWWRPSHQQAAQHRADDPTAAQSVPAQFTQAQSVPAQFTQAQPTAIPQPDRPSYQPAHQPNRPYPNQTWAQPAGYYPTAAGGWRPPTSQPTGAIPPSGVIAVADPQPKRRRTTLIATSTVALALLAGFGGGFWASSLHTNTTSSSSALTSLSAAPTAAAIPAPGAAGSVEQVAAAVLPSVVSILSSSSSAEGEGSGIILSADGLILTNNHVIDGASTLQVQFNDGTTATAKVVGADSTDDLAVIKADGVSGLTPAAIGSSAGLQVGQDVVAVGSPLGLSATVTSGIVSALNRPVATSDAQQQAPQQQQQQQLPGRGQPQTPSQAAVQATVISAIQTDAAINPGNSGGPLVDMSGKVIGINSAIASLSDSASGEAGSIGLGFAIPIDQAKRIADEIVATGKASHAVLGASVGDAAADANSLLTTGAQISAVTAGGAAAAGGLQVGDVITKVGDQKVESADALIAAVRSAAPNSAVTITYARNGDSATANVTLGSSTE